MTTYRKTLITLLLTMIVGVVMAQNGVNSPYSRYGFGLLSDQSTGANKGMGGIAYGLRNKHQINVGNPASYSAIDSLTFNFDAGITLQNTNFDNGTLKMNTGNSSLDYLALQFRMFKNIGMTAGFIPYSKANYSFSTSEEIRNDEEGAVYSYESFAGNGGLTQAFIGVGAQILPGLSVGANLSYLWGDFSHSITNSYSSTSVRQLLRSYTSEVKTYKADFGIQYTHNINNKQTITVGATYSLGHNVDDNAYKIQQTVGDNSSSVIEKIDTLTNAYQIPHTFGVGFTYTYDKRFTVGVDYTLQQWKDVKFPNFNEDNLGTDDKEWEFNNVSRIAAGMEYQPNPIARNLFKRIRYRLGGYYTNSYMKVKGSDSKEFGVGGGFCIPLINTRSDRTNKTAYLSIIGEYVNVKPSNKGLIEENYLKLSIGLTFSELWFLKWKVQ